MMASAYLDEDSDSDRRSCPGGHRHRGRGRRGGKRSVWPRETNVDSSVDYPYADDDSYLTLRDFKSREFTLLTSRNQNRLEERPGHSQSLVKDETHDNVRKQYRRYHREGGTTCTGNSSQGFYSERLSSEFHFGLPSVYSGRGEEKRKLKDNSSDHFDFDQLDRDHRSSYSRIQHTSGRIKNISFYHDRSEIPRRGRGVRGRARGSKHFSRYSNSEENSDREENLAIFDSDWREGMTSVGK